MGQGQEGALGVEFPETDPLAGGEGWIFNDQ